MNSLDKLRTIHQKTAGDHVYYNLYYSALGLASEAGEVAGEVKKVIRNDGNRLTDGRSQCILDELADVLWYVQGVCVATNSTVEELIDHLEEKLSDRMNQGTINER